MNTVFLKYLFLPKGIKSILYKLYVYLIPLLVSFTIQNRNHYNDLILFFAIVCLFELIINPCRYQLNDIKDYHDDNIRGTRWIKPVNDKNKKIVIMVALIRFFIGFFIIVLLNKKLIFLALSFILLQLLYDYVLKPFFPLISVMAIAIAYPLRSLTIFWGLSMEMETSYYVLLLSVFVYSFYMAMQWRKQESVFIFSNNLVKKPFSEYFYDKNINNLIFFVLILFLLTFNIGVSMFNNLNLEMLVISLISSIFWIAILIFAKENLIKLSMMNFNSVAILIIFAILIQNIFLNSLMIFFGVSFLLFWYDQIYVKKFANNYFNQKHYETC